MGNNGTDKEEATKDNFLFIFAGISWLNKRIKEQFSIRPTFSRSLSAPQELNLWSQNVTKNFVILLFECIKLNIYTLLLKYPFFELHFKLRMQMPTRRKNMPELQEKSSHLPRMKFLNSSQMGLAIACLFVYLFKTFLRVNKFLHVMTVSTYVV